MSVSTHNWILLTSISKPVCVYGYISEKSLCSGAKFNKIRTHNVTITKLEKIRQILELHLNIYSITKKIHTNSTCVPSGVSPTIL